MKRVNSTQTIADLTGQAGPIQAGPIQAGPIFDKSIPLRTPAPADGRDGTFSQNFGKFERLGATFSWIIHRPGTYKLYGHSKPKNMAEKANKQELLIDCIRRLAHKGYIREGLRIEFYRNFSDSDADSVKIVTLHGTRYVPEPCIITGQEWLIKYLNNFYNPVIYNYGRDMFPTNEYAAELPANRAIIPDPATQASVKDPFDLSRTYKSCDELMRYTEKLQRDGHPHGRITEYYRLQMQAIDRRAQARG